MKSFGELYQTADWKTVKHVPVIECPDKVKKDEMLALKVVVISLGAGGAIGVWKDENKRMQTPTVPVRSKVGAGDSTVAGIILAPARGESLGDALRFGVAAGAAAVMTPGTELCRREDTERLYRQMISLKEH